MAGVVVGTGAGFHWMSLENTKEIVRMKTDLRTGSCEEVDNHRLRRAPVRLPSASSVAGRLLLLFAMEFLGVLVLETESLGWQWLKDRRLGERLRVPEFLIYGTGEEIVAGDRGAYPKKFEKWRDFLSQIVAESFGIRIESYSV
jgi:hypothetical protein